MFSKLPEGVYEVDLPRPLGIVFEEVEAYEAKGVRVAGKTQERSGGYR